MYIKNIESRNRSGEIEQYELEMLDAITSYIVGEENQDSEMMLGIKKTDVSDELIYRGDNQIKIKDFTCPVLAYDACVTGDTISLSIVEKTGPLSSKYLVIETEDDFHVIFEQQEIEDTNISTYKFKKKGDKTMIEKVVGTTFAIAELPGGLAPTLDSFEGVIGDSNGTPQLVGQALLMPEPDNQYDPNAVVVIAKMKNGAGIKIGYLGKNTPGQQAVKSPLLAELIITEYSAGGDFNDSYVVKFGE